VISRKEPILFEEHFTNNSRQWFESTSEERRHTVKDGTYVIESKVGGYGYATKPIAIPQGENFKIECTVRKIEGVDNFGYGLLWGLKDRDNFYNISIFGEGTFVVEKKEDGKVTRLIPLSVPNSINKFNSTNKLAINKESDQIIFYINDMFAGKTQFEPFFGNYIGFIVYNKQTIAFDDLVVTVKSK
jgi:hypothetical protein